MNLPQPDEERQPLLAQVVFQLTHGSEIGLLEHVGRVDPAAEARIEAHLDHGAEALTVPQEDLGE